MKKPTNIVLSHTGQTIIHMDQTEVLLDKQIKKLLACKPILACILQETVQECSLMSLEEIEQCIEGVPVIEKIPVFPQNEIIEGRAEEDFLEGEGLVRYDIRTTLLLPGKNGSEQIKILIDVEAQKEDKPGYDVTLRALFYCCRMVSSQLGKEFSNQPDDPVKYGNIKKVYSIWICSNTAQTRANSVDRYAIDKTHLIGENKDELRYDIVNAIIVNIGNKHDAGDSDSRMIGVLNNLFNENMDAEEKLRVLNAYGIKVTREVEMEVYHMCTYTAELKKQFFSEGRAEGRAEGQSLLAEAVKRLKAGETPEQILASGMDEETVAIALTIR